MQFMQSKPFSVQCPRKLPKKSDSGAVGKAQVLGLTLQDTGVFRHGMREPDITSDDRSFSYSDPAEYRSVGINGNIILQYRVSRLPDRTSVTVV